MSTDTKLNVLMCKLTHYNHWIDDADPDTQIKVVLCVLSPMQLRVMILTFGCASGRVYHRMDGIRCIEVGQEGVYIRQSSWLASLTVWNLDWRSYTLSPGNWMNPYAYAPL